MAPSDVRYDMLFTSLFFCLYVFLLLPFLHRRRQGVLTAHPLNTSSRSGWYDLPLPCRTRETDLDGEPEKDADDPSAEACGANIYRVRFALL